MENERSDSFMNETFSPDYQDSSASHRVVLIAGHNRWEWVYMVLSISSTVLLLTCSFCSLSNCPVTLLEVKNLDYLVSVTACISLLFAAYGVFWEHQYEIYMHSFLLLLALLFSWVRFAIDLECYYIFKMITNITECVMCLSGFLLALKATHEADWVEFKIVGVSDVLSAVYKQICYVCTLLKVDSICMVLFAFYSADISFSFSQNYYWLYQSDIILYAIMSWLLGKLAIFLENHCLVWGFCYLNMSSIILIFYQMHSTYVHSLHMILKSSTLCFALLLLGIKLDLMCKILKCSRKFGQGLNTDPFRELVSRNSSNLLSRSRSALLFHHR